jgi:UDP-N-acetyl-D-galactosamine dehydrogenase
MARQAQLQSLRAVGEHGPSLVRRRTKHKTSINRLVAITFISHKRPPERGAKMALRIAVIGLGYVGLPVALAFGRKLKGVIGFDVDPGRIEQLKAGHDRTGEADSAELATADVAYTCDPKALANANVFVICVPTPIHKDLKPDLRALEGASRTVAANMPRGSLLIYESTVYPGLTEEYCGPIVERESGYSRNEFKLGYSPERINPGDKIHSLERIVKVVSGEDDETVDIVADLYGKIIDAGVHRASSIKVAEAAKVIENTQRDLNIALMNEIAIICDRLDIRTRDVLEAAGTKWNFLKFQPGLVGGHCIGVDPYYLTSKAQELGYHPEVILAGRRINDSMGAHIAGRVVRMLGHGDKALSACRVGVLGLTFKENVPDLRNSKIPDVLKALATFGIEAILHDPLADPNEAQEEFGISISDLSDFVNLDALVLGVPHGVYCENPQAIVAMLAPGGGLFDVKSALDPAQVGPGHSYWCL